ncbi:hypothetical protein [Sedimentibacter sp. B4]|uniref:hypothetical protein n=1 Tax=Sedimentibacter sp. B4 TaxID=304766 RepID=UPI00030A0956|nr:hypothetical protein [Sedimentibacter sp. B4]
MLATVNLNHVILQIIQSEGFACGVPSTLGWLILRNYADAFISCPDSFAALAMRMLRFPLKGDFPIVSRELGAAGLGIVWDAELGIKH